MATPFGQLNGPPSLGQLPLAGPASAIQGAGLPPSLGAAPDLSSMFQSQASPDEIDEDESAINKLKPGSEKERRTRERLNKMFEYSWNAMSQNHPRWLWQEQKVQAYIKMPDYKQLVEEFKNNTGAAPEPVQVIVPYTYSTIHAAATFIYAVLAGRRPIFPLLATRGTTTDKARYMEQAVQASLEATKAYEAIWQYVWDCLNYGFGAVRIGWCEERGNMISLKNGQREKLKGLKYAGNKLQPIDPYCFFPDPRVPMHEVNVKGDFVFWTTSQSKMVLKDRERRGQFKWIDEAAKCVKDAGLDRSELPAVSNRRARIGMNNQLLMPSSDDVVSFLPLREGTARLVAKDWDLGDEEESAIWKFTWVKGQIIQAQPLNMAHDKHPVAVTEPTSFGHEFGSIALADFVNPFQDVISWLVNSRMENVRTTINNQFVVDPFRIEMQDLRQPAPGKAIRLKQTAIGTPVGEAIQQLITTDVTQGHMNDIQLLRLLADTATGVNDNLRGVNQGGRRSATEARISMQAGASRLSQLAIRISSQGMMDICGQMIMNIQQFMPQEMWVEVTGDEGGQSTLMTPDMLVGEFNYQISDGSLPYDKTALLEVWKEIMFGVAQDPELRQTYSVDRIFEYVATLGGAKNIASFKKPPPPPQAPAGPFAPGQPPAGAVPAGPALPSPPRLALPAPPQAGSPPMQQPM
jgi:hypothetical protein